MHCCMYVMYLTQSLWLGAPTPLNMAVNMEPLWFIVHLVIKFGIMTYSCRSLFCCPCPSGGCWALSQLHVGAWCTLG